MPENNLPKVAIVYLSFHSEPYLPDVIDALKKLNYPKELVEFVIVDNPHPVYELSKSFIDQHVLPLSGTEIPHVTYLPQEKNLGFGIGNNTGVTWALNHGFDYVFFHNNDGSMAPDCIIKLVDAMEADQSIGIAQSLILLDPEKHLVNSSGNMLHYLGFGYCGDYKKTVAELNYVNVRDVPYASGAAFMISTKLLQEIGAWDTDFFMYHEDLEFSLRTRIICQRIVCVLDSVFFHKYEFSRSVSKYYWMERNRFGVLLMFYKWPTLLLIVPILLALEFGLFVFAIKGGWWKEKVKVYWYWLNTEHWKLWLSKRHKIQVIRQIDDQELLKTATAKILFQETDQQHWLVTQVANPIMQLYFDVLMKIIVW